MLITLSKREAFFDQLARNPVRSCAPTDRAAYFRNMARRRPEPGLAPRMLWILATAKTKQAERFGLFPALEVLLGDVRVKKNKYSAFMPGSSDIDARLKAHDIDTVLITGTATNVCCESTVRDAMLLDYKVIMLSDGTATLTEEEHAVALNTFMMFFGDVMSTARRSRGWSPSRTARLREVPGVRSVRLTQPDQLHLVTTVLSQAMARDISQESESGSKMKIPLKSKPPTGASCNEGMPIGTRSRVS